MLADRCTGRRFFAGGAAASGCSDGAARLAGRASDPRLDCGGSEAFTGVCARLCAGRLPGAVMAVCKAGRTGAGPAAEKLLPAAAGVVERGTGLLTLAGLLAAGGLVLGQG